MWFLVTGHAKPLFYKTDPSKPVAVEGIEYTGTATVDGVRMNFKPEIVKDSMQAISVLYHAGVPGYETKKDAREAAKAMGLTTYCYFNTVQSPPDPHAF